MKKNLISILCGVIILVIGICLFLTTYLQGATGFHSDFVNIGFDEYHNFGVFHVDNHHGRTDSTLNELSSEVVVEEAPWGTEIASSSTSGAPTTEWNLADMDSFNEISLNVNCADVKISTAANGSGKIIMKKLSDVSCYVADRTLYVEAHDTNSWGDSINGRKVEITLPASIQLDDLSAYLGMGDFSCSGLKMSTADISTDLGEVTLKNMKADTLNVTSHCGKIDLEDIQCSNLTAGADLGDLDVKGTIGEATLTISMGNCEFEGTIGDFTINNDMGNIEMEITGDSSDYYIDVTNDMGEIQVHNQKTNGSSCQYGDPDAPHHGTVYSSMGNVEIEFDRD